MTVSCWRWQRSRLNHNALNEFCVINVDYGIGSSFVINGEIFRGSLNGSGRLDIPSSIPTASLQGCLETAASLSALKQAAGSHYADASILTRQQLLAAAAAGEPWIAEWAQRAAEAIGISLYNFLNTLNINQIWLYGRSCSFGEVWLDTIVRQIDFNPFDPRDTVKSQATNVHFGKLDRAHQVLGIGYVYVEGNN